MTIFVFQKHALWKRIFYMYCVESITNRTGVNGTLVPWKKQAFVSRNQQENAYINQIRFIYQDKQHEYHIYYADTN